MSTHELDPITHEDPAYARGWNDALGVPRDPCEHAEWCASRFELLPEDPSGGPTGVMGPCDCEFDRLTKLLEDAEEAGYQRGRADVRKAERRTGAMG